MKVRLKRAFFIDGFRYESAGVHEMPDAFKGRLPSDAEILGSSVVSNSAPTPPARQAPPPKSPPVEKAKGYRLPPKEFTDPDTEATVPFADAVRHAVREYISEAPKNTLESWNELSEDKRKERIIAASVLLLKG